VRKIGLAGFVAVAVLLFALTGCSGELASPSETMPLSSSTDSAEITAEQSPAAEQTTPAPAVASPTSTEEASQPPTPSATPKATPKPTDTVAPAVDSITFSIVGNAEWGTVVATESVILANGDTAAGVLKRVAKAKRLSYEIRGSGAMTYVEGIDGLYEFDDGPTSGWKYRVNGIVPDIGAGSYILKSGDQLEWFYTSGDEAAQKDKESAP
jgi:hypothetical protein